MMIVGWGDNMLETARAFADERLMGYQLTAFLIPEEKQKPIFHLKNDNGEEIPCISISRNPEALFKRLDSPHLVLALEQGGLDHYQDLIQRLSRLCDDLHIVPSLRGLPLYGMGVSHFFSHDVLLLTVRNNLARRGPQLIKRCFDILAASAILLAGSPFLIMIALGVASSGRPIFFGHKRIGRNGKVFSCYKFRTMLPNSAQMLKDLLERDPEARKEWDRDFKLKNDPRITPLGHFLRKTSLDELPQLWNVVKGEMSLVGPRPVVDAELERYGSNVDLYLEARPGITGIWQISGRNDISYDSRVYLDGWYVKNWSFFNDLVILIKTVKVIFKRDGAY
jgi:undecaprenyl-phosphate galactose phosphotransferase